MFLTDEDRAKIVRIADAMFVQQRALAQTPRMAAAVVLDGELVSFTGHDATDTSLFRIASMTKSFTAAATLMLRDAGSLVLDEPVATYAPELRALVGPTSDAPAITLRHLLTMSSGIVSDDPWGDRHLDITDAELDAIVDGRQVFGEHPGTAFEYSNFGYGIIGRVIHRVTGIRPQEFISRNLLAPLGMTRTVWESTQAPSGTDVVVGTRSDNLTPESIPLDGGLATMGGLWSTVADLAKWVGFFTDAFPPRNDAEHFPLNRASRREMQRMHTFHEPLSHTTADGTPFANNGGYGMGLLLQHDPVLGEIVGHSGGLPGYGSNMRWVKGSGFGVVALGNATYAPMAAATRRVLDALSAATVVRRPKRELSPEVAEAGASLLSLLNDWSDELAGALFADNVDSDGPFSERASQAAKLTARHGPLRLARIEALNGASGRIIAHGPTGEVSVEFTLALFPSTAPCRIQSYELPAG